MIDMQICNKFFFSAISINTHANVFIGLLQLILLLVLAVFSGAKDTYVVLAPKIIRPGLDARIHYNTRNAPSYDLVKTSIIQNGAEKASTTRTFVGGKFIIY